MGSIMMHVYISEQIEKKYNFSDKFLVGSVLPDIYKRTIMSRDESHYIERKVENGYVYQLPNLKKYVEDHKDTILHDDVTLGYFAHLVEDYVWFKYVSGAFTKVRENEEKYDLVRYKSENYEIPHAGDEYVEEIYKDYSNMNEWLHEKSKVDIEHLIQMIREHTRDERAIDFIKHYSDGNANYKERQNVFLTEEIVERYIKASIEMFDLNYNKLKNS